MCSIEMSPFTFPHSPSRTFTGSKHTSLLTIDLRTGHQITCFSSLHNSSVMDEDCLCDDSEVLDDLEGKARSNRDVLFVGRTDYRLTIHTPPSFSGVSAVETTPSEGAGLRKSSGVQEITYSTYTPNSYDKALADYWTKYGATETMWETDGSPAKRSRIELGHDGIAVGVDQDGLVKWNQNLGSVG
jgi:serine/threonine-protein kinase/endoribonuclease IRE1